MIIKKINQTGDVFGDRNQININKEINQIGSVSNNIRPIRKIEKSEKFEGKQEEKIRPVLLGHGRAVRNLMKVEGNNEINDILIKKIKT